MRSAHRIARPALLVSAALLLSACGIPTTGVVESGAPGTGIKPPTLVYFYRNGVLVAAPRDTGRGEEVAAALGLLFRGPNRQERRAGVTTELPQVTSSPKVRNDGAKVWVTMAANLPLLGVPAVEQLVCTVVHARRDEGSAGRPVQVILVYASAEVRPGYVRPTHEADASCSRATEAATLRPG